jgi:hypothetical protein
VDQIAISILVSERFAKLLQCPGSCGMRRDIQMQQPTSTVLNHHENVEQAKRRSDRDAEIAGDHRARVVA